MTTYIYKEKTTCILSKKQMSHTFQSNLISIKISNFENLMGLDFMLYDGPAPLKKSKK